LEINMKTALLMFCFLCTTAALGQTVGGFLNGPTMNATVQMAGHAAHASAQPMAREQSLLEGSSGVYIAHGEIPLAEVPLPEKPAIPLGDTARLLKKQHETAKKAQFVYEN
jgi:hypothetical protein